MRAKSSTEHKGVPTTESSNEEALQLRTPFRWRGGQDSRPGLSVERVKHLVRVALPSGEDEAARALIELLAGITYEPDALRRDELALYASEEAFTLTQAFSNALDEFASGGNSRGGG